MERLVVLTVVSDLHRLWLRGFEKYICLTSAFWAFFLALLSWFLLGFMVAGRFGSRSMNVVPGGECRRNGKRYGTGSLVQVQVQVRARIDLAKDNGVGGQG